MRLRLLLLALLLLGVPALKAASTTVSGTITDAQGTGITGSALISWDTFVEPDGALVSGASIQVAITSGSFSVSLAPNVGSTPSGTSYRVLVRASDGSYSAVQYWVVPNTGTATLAAVVQTSAPSPSLSVLLSQLSIAGVSVGDLISAGAGPSWARLPIGAEGEVLTVESGVPAWAAGGGGGAPDDAQYWVSAADGDLSAEVVVTNEAQLETALGSIDVMVSTELDTIAELQTLIADATLLTTADEGTGNGIDADTVDGIEAAGFVGDADTPAAGDLSGSFQAGLTIDAAAVSADELDEAGVESGLEAVLDLQDMQGAVTDGQVPDTITVSSYLPLAGGTLTGSLVTDNLGIEFAESDTNPTCAAGDYKIYADLSETKLKSCQDGATSDLLGGSGAPTTAQYWLGAADGTLSAEIVVSDITTLEAAIAGYDFSDATNLTGDIAAARMSANVQSAFAGGLAQTGCVPYEDSGAIGCDLSFYRSGSAWVVFGADMRGSGASDPRVNYSTGSATSPAYSFHSDTDTGILRPAANQMDFWLGGVKVLGLGGSNTVTIKDETATTGTTQFRCEDGAGQGVVACSQVETFAAFDGVVFSALSTQADGSYTYCTDCTKATPCASGGSGAFAKRINGAWDCN